MAPKKKPLAQKALTSAGFWPMLLKTVVAIGKFVSVPASSTSLHSCTVYHLRQSFPLHYTVFKQTASHIPHEGNNEQLFSRSGYLSDDNGRMNPAHLAVWTSIGVNQLCDLQANRPADSSALHAQVQQGWQGYCSRTACR